MRGGDLDLEMTEVTALKQDLSNEERTQFDIQFGSQRKDPAAALILGILFGYLGVDRFYVGQIGLGVFKLLTVGGFLIWWIVDLFLIMDAAKQRNVEIAREIRTGIALLKTQPPASFCGSCGAAAAPGSKFCGKCGAGLS